MSIVSKRATPEQAMAATSRNLKVSPSDVPIIVSRSRSPETIANKIQLITLSRVIRLRKGVKVCQHHRVVSKSQGIHTLDLRRSQSSNRAQGGVVNDVYIGITCAAIWVASVAHVPDHALPQVIAGHDTQHADHFALARAFRV